MTAITKISANEAYRDLKNLGQNIKSGTIALDTACAGSVGWEAIDRYISVLASQIEQVESLLPTQELNAYTQNLHPELPAYDMVAEYTAIRDLANTVIAWMSVELPKDGGGYELAFIRDALGLKIYRTFTPVQTATLRVELQKIIVAIE